MVYVEWRMDARVGPAGDDVAGYLGMFGGCDGVCGVSVVQILDIVGGQGSMIWGQILRPASDGTGQQKVTRCE